MRARNENSAGSSGSVEGSGSRSRLFNSARMSQILPHGTHSHAAWPAASRARSCRCRG
jgi:hypothetical protein